MGELIVSRRTFLGAAAAAPLAAGVVVTGCAGASITLRTLVTEFALGVAATWVVDAGPDMLKQIFQSIPAQHGNLQVTVAELQNAGFGQIVDSVYRAPASDLYMVGATSTVGACMGIANPASGPALLENFVLVGVAAQGKELLDADPNRADLDRLLVPIGHINYGSKPDGTWDYWNVASYDTERGQVHLSYEPLGDDKGRVTVELHNRSTGVTSELEREIRLPAPAEISVN